MSSNDKNLYHSDELEPPSWLNALFLERALSAYEKDDQVKVIGLKISPATLLGDHYASIMFRAGVNYTNKNGDNFKSLIIKTMPEVEGLKKDQLSESHIFKTEIGMYTEMLPEVERILSAAGDTTKLCADCIYHCLEPQQVIIFEDLVVRGFTVLRDREPTLTEIKLVFSKVAKLHAVTFKMQKEQPLKTQKFRFSILELPKIMEDSGMHAMSYFIKMLEDNPELTQYKPYFEKISGDYMERCRAAFVEYRENPQENFYYVLCHGDLFRRNMMFKHQEKTGELEDCLLLDYQMSNVGPMPNDIIYAIYQLLSPDQRLNHRDELIDYYFAELTESLKKIGYKGELPKLTVFREHMYKLRYLEIFLLMTFLPLIYSLKEKLSVDASTWRDSEDLRHSYYRNKHYVDEVKQQLKRFVDQGYFD